MGNSIRVWEDNWLPVKNKPKVLSPRMAGAGTMRVSDLINPVSRTWKEDLLDRAFYDFEAAIIKNIPLCRSIQEDVLLWPFNPDGQYSVKSGYRFLQETNTLQQPGPSTTEAIKPLWKKIWGLDVPNKVKNLVWRACTNSLPTKVNLVRRKITTDNVCDNCRQHQEDTIHALYHCPTLNPLWSQTPKWRHEALKGSSDFTDNLWNRRNNLRLGKVALPIDRITEHARGRRLEALVPPMLHIPNRTQHQKVWSPPEAHGFKANYDAATFFEENKAGLGVVIRNSNGLVLASLTQQVPLPAIVIELEAQAARQATELALEIGLDSIVLEGANESLFKALRNGDRNLAQYGHIVNDALFLSSFFSKFSVSFVRREGNTLAHSLARKAREVPHMSIWMDKVPPDLVPIFQADFHGLT
ncbi:uncharacterized protein LOC142616078 [Castanea sativa]|uniref:uncharacterized protein LOC142616078 n=1 Tax=Castanea sativa TaxID=21020 RepID=UPI003F652BED